MSTIVNGFSTESQEMQKDRGRFLFYGLLGAPLLVGAGLSLFDQDGTFSALEQIVGFGMIGFYAALGAGAGIALINSVKIEPDMSQKDESTLLSDLGAYGASALVLGLVGTIYSAATLAGSYYGTEFAQDTIEGISSSLPF